MSNTISLQARQPSQALIIAAFAALYIIWGSTYTAIFVAIQHIPPLMMAGLRFIIAGIILYIFFRAKGEQTPGIRDIGKISIGGLLMLYIGTGAVAWAEQYIPSGLTAIIIASTPLSFVLLDKRQWRFNFSNKWIISGLLIGFAGVLTLFADKSVFNFKGDKYTIISFFVLIVATIAWASGSLYTKYKSIAVSTGMKAAFQMISAGVAAMLTSALSGEFGRVDFASMPIEPILALLYLIFFGSLVGYMAYVWLLSVRSPTVVGTYAYVNPVVAVFLGWLIANESITRQQIIALVIILAGVILVTLAKDKK